MAEYIIRGSDQEAASVQFTDNGVVVDLTDTETFPYDSVEVYLVDRYGRERAKYKTPTTDNFRALDITTDPVNGFAFFNIHSADSINFTLGALYAMPVLVDTVKEGWPDGYRKSLDKLYLGEVKQNKI